MHPHSLFNITQHIAKIYHISIITKISHLSNHSMIVYKQKCDDKNDNYEYVIKDEVGDKNFVFCLLPIIYHLIKIEMLVLKKGWQLIHSSVYMEFMMTIFVVSKIGKLFSNSNSGGCKLLSHFGSSNPPHFLYTFIEHQHIPSKGTCGRKIQYIK